MSLQSAPIISAEVASVQRAHLHRLASIYQGRQPNTVLALDGKFYGRSHGLSGNNEIDMLEQSQAWLEDVLAEMAADTERLADTVTFRPAVIELDPLGVHFIDALFGAQIRFHGGQCWSAELPYDLDALECPDLTCSPLFQKALRLCALSLEAAERYRGEGQIYIATPVLACAINVGVNLFGERLLEALHTRPQVAQAALDKINATILEATRAIYAVLPESIRRNSVAENRLAPAGVGQFDGCSTQLVSRKDYRKFFAPLDAALMALSPGGALMHICGAHTQHIPTWCEMPGLRAVQLNDRAMDDLEAYYTGLRPDTVFYLCPSQNVPVERIMEITEGRRVILQTSIDLPIPLD